MSLMEYAQARMQARFSERLDAARWRELDRVRDLAAYLEALRATPLRRWISGLEPRADLHQVDARLRERFRTHIDEVARWMPPEWRPALLWLLELTAPQATRAAWLVQWRRRWPTPAPGLQRIETAVTSHIQRFARGGVRGAWSAREALERELRRLFRRSALCPEVAFAYLGLVALDLERLRAELVRRVLGRPQAAAA